VSLLLEGWRHNIQKYQIVEQWLYWLCCDLFTILVRHLFSDFL